MFTAITTDEIIQKTSKNDDVLSSLHVNPCNAPKHINLSNGTIEAPNSHYAKIAAAK